MGKYKSYCLNFQSTQDSCFYFAIYKMADSEYNMNIYKSVKKSIGKVMRNPEKLKLVPDHIQT